MYWYSITCFELFNTCMVGVGHELFKRGFVVVDSTARGVTMGHEVSGFTLHICPEGENANILLMRGDFKTMSRVHTITGPEELAAFTAQLDEVTPSLCEVLRSGQPLGDTLLLGDLVASKSTPISNLVQPGASDEFQAFPVQVSGLSGMVSFMELEQASGDTPVPDAVQPIVELKAVEHHDPFELDDELVAAIDKWYREFALK